MLRHTYRGGVDIFFQLDLEADQAVQIHVEPVSQDVELDPWTAEDVWEFHGNQRFVAPAQGTHLIAINFLGSSSETLNVRIDPWIE